MASRRPQRAGASQPERSPQRLYMTIPLVPPGPQGQRTGRLRFDLEPLPAWGPTPPPPNRTAPFHAPPGLSCCQREIARIEAYLQAERDRQLDPQPYAPLQAIIIDDTPRARRTSAEAPPPGLSDRFLYDWATCTSWPILYAPNPPSLASDVPPGTTADRVLQGMSRPAPAGCGGMPGAFQGGLSVYTPTEPDPSPDDVPEEDINPDPTDPDFQSLHSPSRSEEMQPEAGVEEEDLTPFTYVVAPPVRLILPPRMNPASLFRRGARAPPRSQSGRTKQEPSLTPAQLRALASSYTAHLERADKELRARMAALGMGDIGAAEEERRDAGDSLLGCAICLEPYATNEDKPSWLGSEAESQHVVAVGCRGFHTLHRGCLRDWLQALQPEKWTCPFCRDPLPPPVRMLSQLRAKSRTDNSSGPSPERSSGQSPRVNDEEPIADEGMGFRNSLRAEVHRRERQRKLRCDAPACLPRYLFSPPVTELKVAHLESAHSVPGDAEDEALDSLTTLSPCKHEVHTDCLRTALRVADPVTATALDEDVQLRAKIVAGELDPDDAEKLPLGHWVPCPACRRESWISLNQPC